MLQQTPASFTYNQYLAAGGKPISTAHPFNVPSPPKSEGKDIWREGVLRYWGYINEIAESLKDAMHAGFSQFPGYEKTPDKIVKASYTAVWPYVGLDSIDKAAKGFKQAKEEGYGHTAQAFTAMEKGIDAFLFQCGASLYGPAFIVSIFRDYSKMALFKLSGSRDAIKHLEKEVADTLENFDRSKNKIELMPERLKQWLFKQPLLDKLPTTLGKNLGAATKVRLAKGIPMVSSLALIPFLIKPIDTAMNLVLDISYRPLMGWFKHAIFGKPIVVPPPHAKSPLTFSHRSTMTANAHLISPYPTYRPVQYQPTTNPFTYPRYTQYPAYPSSFQPYSRI